MQKSHQTHPSAPQKSNIDTKTCHFFKGVTFPIFIILGSGSLNNQVDFYPLKITGTPRIKVDQKKTIIDMLNYYYFSGILGKDFRDFPFTFSPAFGVDQYFAQKPLRAAPADIAASCSDHPSY